MRERVKEIIAHLRARAAVGATELEAERRKGGYRGAGRESYHNNIRWRTVMDLERDADVLQTLLDSVAKVAPPKERREPCPRSCLCMCHEEWGGGAHGHPGKPCPGKEKV